MKELAFQTLVRETVEREGGYGLKMSNRFLVGVPDLLIKLPRYPTACFEAKADPIGLKTKDYRLVLTPKQAYTLRSMAGAGMVAGAVSLLVRPDKQFGFLALPIKDFDGKNEVRLNIDEYAWATRRVLPHIIIDGLRLAMA